MTGAAVMRVETWTASRSLGRPYGPQVARTGEDLLRRLLGRAEGAGGDVVGVLSSEGGSDAASGGDSRPAGSHRRCAESVAENPLPTSGSPLALCRRRPPPTIIRPVPLRWQGRAPVPLCFAPSPPPSTPKPGARRRRGSQRCQRVGGSGGLTAREQPQGGRVGGLGR